MNCSNFSCDLRHNSQFLLLAAAHLSANDKHTNLQNKLNGSLLMQTIMNANLLRLHTSYANAANEESHFTARNLSLDKGTLDNNGRFFNFTNFFLLIDKNCKRLDYSRLAEECSKNVHNDTGATPAPSEQFDSFNNYFKSLNKK